MRNWGFEYLLSPCGPSGCLRGNGDLGRDLLSEYGCFGINWFRVLGRTPTTLLGVGESQRSALVGMTFNAHLLLLSILRWIHLSVTVVSLALNT